MTIPDPENFSDPLENFEPRKYADSLEEALCENEVGNIRHEPFTTIPPDTTVESAVNTLAGLHIACLLVAEDDKLVGVFSERDVLNNVALEYDQVKDRPVSEVMTDNPIYVYETDTAVAALSVMALSGYRHVPVVDLNGKLTGIVSPQRVNEFLQGHASQE